VSAVQVLALGISKQRAHKWVEVGYLHRVLPHVYAVGHRAQTIEAKLMAAVLYAGPGAMLSHATAAWWVGLADSQPYMIDVSTPRRTRSIPGIRVHGRRSIERTWHKRLPVTPFVQTLQDFAARAPLRKVRRALALADFQSPIDARAIEAELPRSCSAKLRQALKRHQPSLARTRSDVEAIFHELCEAADLPFPEINAEIHGWEVDALWRAERLVVEVDGPPNHRTPAQVRRDRQKDFELRAHGLGVLRYSDEQVKHRAQDITAEIQRSLGRG
jgi:very-short-patch-repair endonuclease